MALWLGGPRAEELSAEELQLLMASAACACLPPQGAQPLAAEPGAEPRLQPALQVPASANARRDRALPGFFAEDWAEQPRQPCLQPALSGLARFSARWWRTGSLLVGTAGCGSLVGNPGRPAGVVTPSTSAQRIWVGNELRAQVSETTLLKACGYDENN